MTSLVAYTDSGSDDERSSEQLSNSSAEKQRNISTGLREAPKCSLKYPHSREQSTQAICSSIARKRQNDDVKQSEGVGLPDSIKGMFGTTKHARWEDEPSLHGNRIRTFAHVEGNWATHVFISVPQEIRLRDFIKNVLSVLIPGKFEAMTELHVSLSHTVPIRHHWINLVVETLRENLKNVESCVCDLENLKLLTNDEKTRTFVCIELAEEDTLLKEYIDAVNKSFRDFKLKEYYDNPSFHISIGWCLGDATESVSKMNLVQAKEMLSDFLATNPDLSVLYIHEIYCKTGNKSFVIPLTNSNL